MVDGSCSIPSDRTMLRIYRLRKNLKESRNNKVANLCIMDLGGSDCAISPRNLWYAAPAYPTTLQGEENANSFNVRGQRRL